MLSTPLTPSAGGNAVFEAGNIVYVVVHGLGVAWFFILYLLAEALSLVVRVVKLALITGTVYLIPVSC